MKTQAEKAAAFRKLHERPGSFVIPNPWDVGTARLLGAAGFEALATTSAGFAFSRGLPDGAVPRDEMLRHVQEIVAATALPVSVDLEAGYGYAPEEVATTIRLAVAAGAVGGSIEDVAGDPAAPLIDIGAASERIRAAAEEAARLPFPFMLTARAENFLAGSPDLHDTICRLQAYQEAGADVLYAPGITDLGDIRTLVESVDRPVNVLALPAAPPVAELASVGVARVSVGSAFASVALGATVQAAKELQTHGTYGFWSLAAEGSRTARAAFGD